MNPGRYFWTRVPHWLLFAAVPKSALFLRRQWSIDEAFCLALGVGLTTPFIDFAILRWLPRWPMPLAFVPFLAAIVALLYWRSGGCHFCSGWRAALGTAGAGLLWTVGEAGSGWCYFHHVCMGGHMQHPPYPAWHYAMDAGWALAVLFAAIWMRQIRVSLCILFATLAAYLISYRFLFGCLGGMDEWLPL